MQKITLNGELVLTCPDGFHQLDEAERRSLNAMEGSQWIGLSDPERHIIVTAGWKDPGLLAKLLLNDRDLEKNMEKSIRRSLKPLGFQSDGPSERMIAGIPAQGFRYTYRVQDTQMAAESFVLRKGKTIYYFHGYVRAALREESFMLWHDLLDTVMAVPSKEC